MLLLSILYVILTNFDTFYCHRVDSVLNINQIDFKTQLSHFEENFSSTVKPIRSKREVKEGYVVFPELNFTLLLNDSFDGPNTLNTTWNEHSNVEIQNEKVNNKSNVLDKALMVITRKKRQANDQVAPSLQNSTSLTSVLPTNSTIHEKNGESAAQANSTISSTESPTTPNSTTKATPADGRKILVAKYNNASKETSGFIMKTVLLRNDSLYTLEFVAKVVGYNITDRLLLTNYSNLEKPLLIVYLEQNEKGDKHPYRFPVFDMGEYGLHFAEPQLIGKWVQIRYTLNTKEMMTKDQKHRKDPIDIAGNWKLTFELRAGANNAQEKGVLLDHVTMSESIIAETLAEHFQHTTTTTVTSTSTTSTPTPPETTKPPIKTSHIFGTRGAEIFMIILVLLFGLVLILLAIKYVQLRDKLKEYKLHGGETGNPAYDNPMYGGGHRSPERYIQSGSVPYHIGNNNINNRQ